MFWNSWIRFLDENYLLLSVCSAINLHYLRFDSFGNTFNSLITVSVTGLCLLFPFFVAIFYSRASVAMKLINLRSSFLSKYGAILEGLNLKRQGRIVLIYSVSETLRKLCLTTTIVYMQAYPTFSVFIVNFQAQIMIVILGLAAPFTSRIENNMKLMNEIFMLLCNYHLFLFTDFLL
jgi:hypothetical protein